MNKQMTLAQALKEKARILTRLSETRNRLACFNAVDEGMERPIDMVETTEQESKLTENLIRIKTAIAQGNAPIARQLAQMLSIRSKIQFFQQLDTATVRIEDRQDENCRVKRDVHVTAREVLGKVEALEHQLEEIQDQVDDFNATRRIEVDFV